MSRSTIQRVYGIEDQILKTLHWNIIVKWRQGEASYTAAMILCKLLEKMKRILYENHH